MSSAQDYIDQHNAFIHAGAAFGLGSGEHLQACRNAAISALDKSGLPKPRWEDWRYTNLTPLSGAAFTHQTDTGDTAPTPEAISNWPRLIIINGAVAGEQADKLPAGITLCHGADLAANPPSWAADIFAPSKEPLANLNLAFLSGAYALRVEDNAAIEGIEIIHLFTGDPQNARQCRSHIHLSEGASLKIFNRYIGASASSLGWANIHASAYLADGALLDITSHLSPDCASFLTLRETAKLDAGTYNNTAIAIDLPAARHEIVTDIHKEGAHVELLGANLSAAGGNCDNLTRVNHLVGRSTSNQLFRNVAKDGGKTAFQGRVLVEKDAQQTYADQACNNLVLDNKSEANVKPELLIFADDVKCSHGATIGELDKDALFYLIQRGLDPQSARSILINAFLGEVIEAIDCDPIRTYFQEDIDGWMSKNVQPSGRNGGTL